MATLFDTRQTSTRTELDQLAAADTTLDKILDSVNTELTTPLRMRATAALVVTVDAIAPVNPETGRKRSIPPIAGSLPAFSSGTITIPAANNNNITTNTSAEVLLINIPNGNYIRVGVHLSNNGELSFTSGVNDSVLADATTPPSISAGFFIGEFWIQNIGGTIQNITDANLTQYAGGGGSGGEGSLTTDLAPADLTIETGTTLNQSFLNVPVGVTYTIDGQHVGAELTVGGDYVVNGTSIILGTAQIDQIGLASQLQTGLVSHEAPLQVFGGPKEYVDPVRFTGGFDTTGDAGIATSQTYGLVGGSNGAGVPAGQIGEKVTWVTPPTTVITTTSLALSDWTNAFITLNKGRWHIRGVLQVFHYTGGTANQGLVDVQLTNSSDTVIDNQARRSSVALNASSGFDGNLIIDTIADVTADSTVYKIRVAATAPSTGGCGLANQSSRYSSLYAIRLA